MTLYHANCLDALRELPSDSVHAVVTSPPYFSLRQYLPAGDPLKPLEIGSEPTPEAFIQTMVEVFREVRRVLRPDGTCWINLGDSYGAHSSQPRAQRGFDPKRRLAKEAVCASYRPEPGGLTGHLQNIPHRVAEALRQDGWIWRQTIVWAKRSPMPESVGGSRWMRHKVKIARCPVARRGTDGNRQSEITLQNNAAWADCPGCSKCQAHGGYVLRRGAGRCTTAHEYLFLMTKTSRYFWDGEACKEPQSDDTHERFSKNGQAKPCPMETEAGSGIANNVSYSMARTNMILGGRNPSSVWVLSSEPTSVRHFATYPSELVRRCLVASISAGGCCPSCGAPWAPVVVSERVATRPALNPKAFDAWKHNGYDRSATSPNLDPERHLAITRTLGYRPTCDCTPRGKTAALEACRIREGVTFAPWSVGMTVLDPFNGIGTTGQTAYKLGCRYIGIDLNAAYLDVSATRIFEPTRWWLRKLKATTRERRRPHSRQGVLFR